MTILTILHTDTREGGDLKVLGGLTLHTQKLSKMQSISVLSKGFLRLLIPFFHCIFTPVILFSALNSK